MCGFIFQKNTINKINKLEFKSQLEKIKWRGPDAQKVTFLNNDKVAMGHCRLSILDLHPRSDQPMISECGRFYILLNGEIYNHNYLRKAFNLVCKTESDTETVLNGYIKLGNEIFRLLDGMFSIVIYDSFNDNWIAARDAFGIKPLFIFKNEYQIIISSEAAAIARIVEAKPSKEAMEEWEVLRRPLPGYSFFDGIEEIEPGTILSSTGSIERHWYWVPCTEKFEQSKFETLLEESIKSHELSHVKNVALLSGGLDSALIAKLSNANMCYSIGMSINNEFLGAKETADRAFKELKIVEISEDELKASWRYLTKLRGEPLGVPNEGLIYLVCKNMSPDEKVVLTGEGADELFFGYDGIFRWCLDKNEIDAVDFLKKYGYSNQIKSQRLINYINDLKKNKSPIEFLEDFFYQVHLPGLLRRMDFASMAASKEARVPFISKKLISYIYRQPVEIKINNNESKIPIRKLAEKLELKGALERKKIGFSAKINNKSSRQQEYEDFRKAVMESLTW